MSVSSINCDGCQELLSEFIDGELDKNTSLEMEFHIDACADCSVIYQDFAGILTFCDDFNENSVPPNSEALWCRINNVIENEVKPDLIKQAEEKEASRSRFAKLLARTWSLSFSQAFAAALGIVVITSLLTVVGIENSQKADDPIALKSVQPSLFDMALSKVGLKKTPQDERLERIRQQRVLVEYWNKRVDERREKWNKDLREAFDRNLHEIDQVVFEYGKILESNPQDELSNEMLDSALDEKVQLLREFSEL